MKLRDAITAEGGVGLSVDATTPDDAQIEARSPQVESRAGASRYMSTTQQLRA